MRKSQIDGDRSVVWPLRVCGGVVMINGRSDSGPPRKNLPPVNVPIKHRQNNFCGRRRELCYNSSTFTLGHRYDQWGLSQLTLYLIIDRIAHQSEWWSKIFLMRNFFQKWRWRSLLMRKTNKTIKAGGSTAPKMSEWSGWVGGYPLDCYDYYSTLRC